MSAERLFSLAQNEALTPIAGKFWRMVETQQVSATRAITDSIDEHDVLEAMLDENKPANHPKAVAARLPYLLSTPFRYPPLRHGSRFGSRHEPSMLYASSNETTLLWELAFYKLIFWFDQTVLPDRVAYVPHTSFQFSVNAMGLQLDCPPFDHYRKLLTDPLNYASTQAVGKTIRERGVGLFTFSSARDPNQDTNLAVIDPMVLKGKTPTNLITWLCEFGASGVKFRKDHSHGEVCEFPLSAFLIENKLPRPA